MGIISVTMSVTMMILKVILIQTSQRTAGRGLLEHYFAKAPVG
jgi:hypothetical protein